MWRCAAPGTPDVLYSFHSFHIVSIVSGVSALPRPLGGFLPPRGAARDIVSIVSYLLGGNYIMETI
jgi:hypothetical protein